MFNKYYEVCLYSYKNKVDITMFFKSKKEHGDFVRKLKNDYGQIFEIVNVKKVNKKDISSDAILSL